MKTEENPYSSAAMRRLLLANLYHTLSIGYGYSPATASLRGTAGKRIFIAKQLRQAGATRDEIVALMQ